jgi:hypothetical protein
VSERVCRLFVIEEQSKIVRAAEGRRGYSPRGLDSK